MRTAPGTPTALLPLAPLTSSTLVARQANWFPHIEPIMKTNGKEPKWRSSAMAWMRRHPCLFEHALGEAALIDADVFDDLVRDDVGRHLLFEGLGVKHDDAYGLHLINLLVTMRKATVREEVREAVRALSSTQLDLARSQYIERAKKRVREDLLQQE